MLFFLGTHEEQWLSQTDVPLFISARRLRPRRTLPRARCYWALDSGGFSELSLYGGWRTPARQYAREALRWKAEIGRMAWAAQQDWMCEPWLLAKTGLRVEEHQRRTVANYLELRSLAPGVPWVPVLQGWTPADYMRHVEMWGRAGIELSRLHVVGLGSVCRRQATGEVEALVKHLASGGIRLHGFGFKLRGLERVAGHLTSADSMAWSFDARRGDPLPGCTHRNCANCLRYALAWRRRIIRACSRAA